MNVKNSYGKILNILEISFGSIMIMKELEEKLILFAWIVGGVKFQRKLVQIGEIKKMGHYKERSDVKNCSIGTRVTEGTYSAIIRYCQEVGMNIGELVEYAVSNWISNDNNINEDVKKFFLMKTAELMKQMYEEQNDLIIKSMKEIEMFERDLCSLISKNTSNTMVKMFIENKINSIISGVICLDSLGEGKKLLKTLYEVVGKWRPNLALKSNTKTLTLTFSEGAISMYNIYYSKKKVHSRVLNKDKKSIRDSPRYQKKLLDIKKDKGTIYLGKNHYLSKDGKVKEKG